MNLVSYPNSPQKVCRHSKLWVGEGGSCYSIRAENLSSPVTGSSLSPKLIYKGFWAGSLGPLG